MLKVLIWFSSLFHFTDFVDKKDNSLAFAAFAAAAHSSYPLAVIQVSPQGLPLEFLICFHGNNLIINEYSHPRQLSQMRVQLVTMSLVQSLLGPAPFFHGDWSYNILYGHSLPSSDSRRAIVCFWLLRGLNLLRKKKKIWVQLFKASLA